MDSRLMQKLSRCRGALSHLATQDEDARRRFGPEADEDGWLYAFGSPYAQDYEKLLSSKAVRREGSKTQVVSLPVNSHTRNRLSHSLDGETVGAPMARILGLNVWLVRAGMLGHDIGHTPLGHLGEGFIAKKTGKPFRHEVFGVVVAQHIERKGVGLNLTQQTLRCILNHSRGKGPLWTGGTSAEEDVVMYSDKIAYIFADYNDLFMRKSLRGINVAEYPGLKQGMDWFGKNHRERTFTCIANLCMESAEAGKVVFENSEAAQRFASVKKLMYKVYGRLCHDFAGSVLEQVYTAIGDLIPDVDPAIVFALMNDRDIVLLQRRGMEKWFIDAGDFTDLSVAELLPYLRGRKIDFTDPDLDW